MDLKEELVGVVEEMKQEDHIVVNMVEVRIEELQILMTIE